MIGTYLAGGCCRAARNHFLLVLVFVTVFGCSQPISIVAGPEPQTEAVLTVVKKIKSDRDYYSGLNTKRAIEKALLASNMDAATLLDGCINLLRQGTAKEKATIAEFLGRLGDPKAIEPLVAELDDPEVEVRRNACCALRWLNAKGEIVEPKLLKLCRLDPSPAVRVWAALALDGSHEQDAIAAYQAGLESIDRSLWQLSEEELAKKRKLNLPLPEHIYTKISPKEYKMMMDTGRPRFGRKIKHNDTLYFELYVGGNDGTPVRTEWYRVSLPEKQ